MSPSAVEEARARLAGKRAAHILVIVIAVAFIGASVAQIIPQVFGVQIRPLAGDSPGSPEQVCAEGIRDLAKTLERAGGETTVGRHDDASSALAEQGAPGSFRAGLGPQWGASAGLESACARARHGYDAWAALLRLERAEEQLGGTRGDELATLRRDVSAHLPPDLH